MKPHTFVIHNRWALGDTVCISALARDIHRAYPDKYEVLMAGHYRNVAWLNSPYARAADGEHGGTVVNMEYRPWIAKANNGLKMHFLSAFHKDFERVTGVRVPVTEPKGDIRLTPREAAVRPPGRYWVVVAGGKADMTAKVWSVAYWQRTVDVLAAQGVRCVQAGGDFRNHFHPTLTNVEQFVGKTRSEREFFSLIAGAEGVVCGVTAAMHIAAAFDKPCVVIAGGREAPWWEGYTNCYYPTAFGESCAPVAVEHTYLHTIGLLDCGIGNLKVGCWRDKTVPVTPKDAERGGRKLCRKPVIVGHQSVPECLKLITPDHVVEAVMNYYEKGVLPPIGTPTRKYSLPVVHADPAAPDADRTVLSISTNENRADPLNLGAVPPLGWNPAWERELPRPLTPRQPEGADFSALDHPYVGGKFTLFVLGYGDHLDLVERCLTSIFDTCPTHRYDLRVALNQPSPRVRAFVQGLVGSKVRKLYVDDGQRKKYPAMREMFHDPDLPIETPYVCWFDDDSWCRKADWMVRLRDAIVANHPHQGRLYGAWMFHDLAAVKRQGALREKWFQAAPWWRGRPLHTAGGRRTAPNGSQIVFASGGFWALATHVIREAEIPDERLNHNGGDITIGAQVTQAGYKVINFSPRPAKEVIAWSDSPRRGFREDFPWA